MIIKLPIMKTVLVFLGSIVLSSLVVGNAFYQKKQFFPSILYISKSNASLAVIYLQIFVFAIALVKFVKTLFFGRLRPAEIEHILEKGWFAITETCLAFTLFRDDFNPKFVALFGLLLVVKCFHWLGEDRADYMERSPIITWLFKFRMTTLLKTLMVINVYFIREAYITTLAKGATVQMVFGFEYAILLLLALNIYVKYLLYLMDIGRPTPWENKATYLLYLELITGFLRVSLYTAFIGIMMRIHTFPLFAIRPMYMSFKNLKRSCRDVVMSRRAIINMNTLYPNPDPSTDFPTITSEQPLSSSMSDKPKDDSKTRNQSGTLKKDPQAASMSATSHMPHHLLCIICREEIRRENYLSCKKLPCNHIFHTSCLRGWFQRQQTCPTCRLNVLKIESRSVPDALNNNINNNNNNNNNNHPLFPPNNLLMRQAPGNLSGVGFAPSLRGPPPFYGGTLPPYVYFNPYVNNVFFQNNPNYNANVGNGRVLQQRQTETTSVHFQAQNQPNNLISNAPQVSMTCPNNFPMYQNPYYKWQQLSQQYTQNTQIENQHLSTSKAVYQPNANNFKLKTFSQQIPPCDTTAYISKQSQGASISLPQQNLSGPNSTAAHLTSSNATTASYHNVPVSGTPYLCGALTEQELRAMEGNELAHIIKRVECLKNVQALLDAAILQIHQYMSFFNYNGTSENNVSTEHEKFITSAHQNKDASDLKNKELLSTKLNFDSPIGNVKDPEIRKRRIEKLENQN